VGTRSFIGIQNKDLSVEGVYCHFDGYPSNQLPLLENYNTEGLVRNLIGNGGFSSLQRLAKNIKYYVDRGEELDIIKAKNKLELTSLIKQYWFEWLYVFSVKTGKWTYRSSDSKKFRTVKKEKRDAVNEKPEL
jgi:hypothetical protein